MHLMNLPDILCVVHGKCAQIRSTIIKCILGSVEKFDEKWPSPWHRTEKCGPNKWPAMIHTVEVGD